MQIYIYKNNQQSGPFDENIILGWLQTGQLSQSDFACRQGKNQWQTLGEMFLQAKPSAGFANLPNPYRQPQPQKSGGSKMLRFGMIGVGGIMILSVIGTIACSVLSGKKASNLTTNQLSDTNANANLPASKPVALNAKDLKNKSEELAKMSPPQKIEKNPTLKGKIAIVEKDHETDARILGFDYDGLKYDGTTKPFYGIADAQLATRPEEIDTLIQILCSKGKRIGSYINGSEAYAGKCKVSIIDYKTPSVITQKTFVDSKPPSEIRRENLDLSDVISYPLFEIQEFIKGFPKS